MILVAHSSPKDRTDIEPHSYADHIREAVQYGLAIAKHMFAYSNLSDEIKIKLLDTLVAAIMLHDLGKLDPENQAVLNGITEGRLPIDHIDAGVAVAQLIENELVAWLIRGHHSPGLPSRSDEKNFKRQYSRTLNIELKGKLPLRGGRYSRDGIQESSDLKKHLNLINHTDNNLKNYIDLQKIACGDFPTLKMELPNSSLLTRLMLSCLVDCDHGSAAYYNSGKFQLKYEVINNQWNRRLIALQNYITEIKANSYNPQGQRNQLRSEIFEICACGNLFENSIVCCSAPVGLGKTTSVIAYLLRHAEKHNLRRIIIVAPFTNIISQTTKVLRRAIVFAGEDPMQVVVEHHHKVDFGEASMREYATLWKAPVVVTTSVQLFETLASANPTVLRKLNSLPGSAIFIDEAHTCLPPHLLRVGWYWLRELADNWNCRIVLSSGSLIKFWEYEEFINQTETEKVPDILDDSIRFKAMRAEKLRVVFERLSERALDLKEFIELVLSKSESQDSSLIIVNTVQSAAVIARELAKMLKEPINTPLYEKKVLHLSTALAPVDREIILLEIERRQAQKGQFAEHWYLVATSCVEAGVDLDFSIGYRERCSVTSFLQIAGRINRHGFRAQATLYDFSLCANNDGLIKHPNFMNSIAIFDEFWSELQKYDADFIELSTRSIRLELARNQSKIENSKEILNNEINQNFQQVMNDFKVINSDTVTMIVRPDIVDKLRKRIPISWQEIQKNSVQLWMSKAIKLRCLPISDSDRIYSWIDTYEYDPKFLGIMAGLLKALDFTERGIGGVI